MLHKALYSFLCVRVWFFVHRPWRCSPKATVKFGVAGATTIQQGFDFIVHLRYVSSMWKLWSSNCVCLNIGIILLKSDGSKDNNSLIFHQNDDNSHSKQAYYIHIMIISSISISISISISYPSRWNIHIHIIHIGCSLLSFWMFHLTGSSHHWRTAHHRTFLMAFCNNCRAQEPSAALGACGFTMDPMRILWIYPLVN